MVYCSSDRCKQESDVTDLCDTNFKNNLYIAIASVGIEGDSMNFSYIYNDIDNKKQNPTLKLLFAISNIKVQAAISNLPTSTIFIFCTRDQLVPLNN